MAFERADISSISDGEKPAQTIRPGVFILSDVRLLCDGLVLGLSQQASLIVLGASDLSTAPSHIAEPRPDVLLLDIGKRGDLDVGVHCRQILPDLKIVAIALAEVDQEVFACAEAGVSGFVFRDGSIQDVVTAVHCAMRDELVCSPHTAALLCRRVAALSGKRNAIGENSALTPREQEIVSLVSEGLSNKEIARRLRIENATVKNHVHSILGKLQVHHRGEVTAQLRATGQHGSGWRHV